MKKFMRFIIVAFCLLPLTILAKPIELTNMQVHELGHTWQFIFYLSGSTNYRLFRLENPSRLVLDLKNVTTKQRLRYKSLLGTPIAGLRYSPHQDNIFRIVFDLAMPVEAKIREISDGSPHERKLELAFVKKSDHVAAFDWPADIKIKSQRSLFEENVIATAPDTKKKT